MKLENSKEFSMIWNVSPHTQGGPRHASGVWVVAGYLKHDQKSQSGDENVLILVWMN